MLILTDTSADIKGKKKVARYIFAKQQEAETGKTFAKPSLEIDSGMGRSSSPFGQQAGEGMFFPAGLVTIRIGGNEGAKQSLSKKAPVGQSSGHCKETAMDLSVRMHSIT